MRALAGLIVGLSLAATGCSEPSWPSPVPEAVEPSRAWAGESVEVVIRGREFLPRVQVHFGDTRQSSVDGTFSARLGAFALEDVRYVSTTELRARIPALLPAGTYALTVVGPTGGTGVLEGGFEVTPIPASHLAFVSPPHVLPAGGCSGAIVVELQDGAGAPVVLEHAFALQLGAVPAGALQLHADPACTSPLTRLEVPAGASRATFYASGTSAGAASVQVTSVLGTVEQAQRLLAGPVARIAWDPIISPRTRGVGFAVAARATDAFGNAVDGTAVLTVAPEVGLACLEGCREGLEAVFTAGELRAIVSLATAAASVRLTATLGAVSGESAAFDVVEPSGDAPARVAFATASRTVAAGACSPAVLLELRDAAGAPVAAQASTPLTLQVAPAGFVTLFADAACTMPLGSLGLAPGEVQRAVYFSGRTAGRATVSISASGLSGDSQWEDVVPGETATLLFGPIPSPQLRGMDIPVSLRAADAYGNPTPAFAGPATLAISPAVPLLCSSGCEAGTATAVLSGGVWQGTVRVGMPVGSGRVLHAAAGDVTGSSDAFDVVDPSRTPPLARLTRSAAVIRAGQAVTFDASGSTDAETGASALEVSWDPEGARTTPAPWSTWTTLKTVTHTFAKPGLYRARVAVRDGDGDVGHAQVDVLVLDAAAELCVVTDGGSEDDGPSTCGDSDDLTLVEAVRISNTRAGKQTLTFAPGLQVSLSRLLTLTDDVDIIGPSGLPAISGVQWQVEGGRVLLSSLDFQGSGGGRVFGNVGVGALLRLSGVSVRGYRELNFYGSGAVEGSQFSACDTVCVVVEKGAGSVRVSGSRFSGSGANGINFHGCGEGGALHEVVGSVFTGGLNKGYHLKSGCGPGPVVSVNNTFDRTQSGAYYDAGAGHVLVNNVFSNLSGDAVRGCAAGVFAARSHSLSFNSPADACGTGSEPGSLVADPEFVSGSTGDYRLRPWSPARDRGLDTGHDVTPWAPGGFLGLAPDLGGVETW